jgi:hypothetical protein
MSEKDRRTDIRTCSCPVYNLKYLLNETQKIYTILSIIPSVYNNGVLTEVLVIYQ